MSYLRSLLPLTALCLSILSLTTSCAFSKRTCLNLLEDARKTKYDIVIVPGVPFENGKWSFVMKGRIYWSKYLYDNGITKNVIYSGAAVYTPYCEAEIMAMYAARLGIPEENIFTETLAEHSTENVFYSYKKARKLGFQKIALATDPFQAKMLKRFTKKIVSPDVGIIPIVTDILNSMEKDMIDPEIEYEKAFRTDFTPLPERKNMRERFRGTRGQNINRNAYE